MSNNSISRSAHAQPAYAGPGPTAPETRATEDNRLRPVLDHVADLEKQVDRMFVFFAAITGIISATSIAGFFVSMVRTGQAHKLAMAGERSAQSRAADVHDTFLAESKNTLTLVNETLSLAKDASERAAKIIQERALHNLELIDREARNLIKPSSNDRRIIETQAARSALQSVVQKIGMFETNSFMFPTELPLTPPCLFIRGLGFHLDQQYDDAIEYWNRGALSNEASDEIKTLCWYWTGYVYNNRGIYDQAEDAFARSLETATGSRKYELRRIAIETRFFNSQKYKPDELISPLDVLLQEARNDVSADSISDRIAKIITTLANVLLRHSFEADLADSDRRSARERAKALFTEVSDTEKWASFGLAETLMALGETESARSLYQTRVFEIADKEYVHRAEPRTKVLAKTTELICCDRVKEIGDRREAIYGDLRSALGQIDDAVTVFSQFVLRNVMKREFMAQLDKFSELSKGTPPVAPIISQ